MIKNCFLLCSFFLFLLSPLFMAQNAEAKLRLAYVEGGTFPNYTKTLHATVNALYELGIIEKTKNNASFEDIEGLSAKELWTWLSKNIESQHLEFVDNAFYSADWDGRSLKQNIYSLAFRTEEIKDIDLVFAMGTVAGVEIGKIIETAYILNASADDPVASGISKSADDSGKANLHAIIEEDRSFHELRLFHEIYPFKSLGICYENTAKDKAEIGYTQIQKASESLNFTLIEGILPAIKAGENPEKQTDRRVACHKRLASQVEAMYLTNGNGNSSKRYTELLNPFVRNKVPTFAQTGPQSVAQGALLSPARNDIADMGYFEALVIQEILQGKSPQDIAQRFSTREDVALNLRMALEIGWELSFELLSKVAFVYKDIKNQ